MTVRETKKIDRKNRVAVRLARLVRLRELKVPLWVIKSEQIALVLNSKGKRHAGIGKDGNQEQERLYAKHVAPLMEGSDDE